MRYTSLTKEIYTKLFASTFIIQIVNTISFFLDFIIPGTFFGEEALSVITLTMPLLLLLQAYTDMVSMGGSNAFSMEIGAGNTDAAHRYFTATIIGSVAVGCAIMLLGWLFIGPLVSLLGATPALFDITTRVTLMSLGFFILMPAFISLDFFVRNDGHIQLAAADNVFFIICNVVLNIYLVGYTSWGIVGAPLSSILSALLSMIPLAAVFFLKNTTLRFSRHTRLKDFLHIIRMGSGLTFKHIYQGTAVLIFNNFLMGFYGMAAVVVYSVIVNVQALLIGILDSIRESIQPLIGSYLGEKNIPGIRETMLCSRTTGITFCLLFWLLLEIMPASALHIFGIYDEAVLALSLEAIHIYAFVFPFLCFTELISSYYQFIGFPRLTFYILTIKGFLLLLPISLLGFWFFGLNGLWLGFVLTEALSSLLCLWLAHRKALRSQPPLSSVLLLDESLLESSLFFDFPLTQATLMEKLDEIETCLMEKGFPIKLQGRVRLCLEEIGLNILQYNPQKKNPRMELQFHLEESIRLSIRDNCTSFNTTTPKQSIEPQFGLQLVRQVASEFQYIPTIGYNRTILTFRP